MQQRTFILGDEDSFENVLAGISDEPSYKNASGRLLVVFEPNCSPEHCAPKIGQMVAALPDAQMVGMTTLGPNSDGLDMPKNTMCSLLTFETSEVKVFSYDCHKITPLRAGQQFVGELTKINDIAGILFMSSSIDLLPAPFIDAVSKDYPEVPIFGAQAGTKDFAFDQSMIMGNGQFFDRGINAIVFSGKDLHVQVDYNMGFRPLGREFTITECGENGIVLTIDDLPAASIYERYLNVTPDQYFYDNVCAFPLLSVNNNLLIPRVPLSCTEDGALKFSMNLPVDERVSLGYSKPEYLLRETLTSANAMAKFKPDALLLFACMNRRIFMGNEKADREFAYYANANPNVCWTYGFGEVYKTWEGGGILNSSLVAVGMREGAPSDAPIPEYVDIELQNTEEKTHANIPLSDRMITFLEATSADLRAMIDNLSLLAQRDTLTGLYNRRYMNEHLGYELSRLKEGDRLVLLMYDIDHFKRINDTYGHDVGDGILRELTARVEEAIRTNDVLSRWGGEEFLLLFTRADPSLAMELAERVRRHVEERDFKPVGRVTISVGVTLGTPEDTVDTLFKRVDEALYEAKNTGRNRVCMK